jgi:DNA-binding beta-propeller fold protein YncE
VYRVRTADGQILGSSEVGGEPAQAVLSLDGTELYVANQSYPSAWVDALDAQSLQLKKRVDVPGAFAIALHPDGRTLFVLSTVTMYVFSPATMTIRYSCPFPWAALSGASQIVFTSDGRAIIPTAGGLDILPKQP